VKLHDGALEIDAELVGGWSPTSSRSWPACRSGRSPRPGTVNAIYRLGDGLYARLPRRRKAGGRPGPGAALAPEARPAERALEAPVWDATPVWIHRDLLRPNLPVRDGRLHAVIDYSEMSIPERILIREIGGPWIGLGPP
jgi:hypothetical protein